MVFIYPVCSISKKMDVENVFYNKNKPFNGPLLLKPKIFFDERGFFMESWNMNKFQNIINNDEITSEKIKFVQDNHSCSNKGVLRGLHFQASPFAQGKLVRCISGEVFDVLIDIRKNSKSFGNWAGVFLSAKNFKQLWIPKGFAHGFLAISDNSELFYKTTNFWEKNYEKTIRWNDPTIGIEWPNVVKEYTISEKDSKAPSFRQFFNLK